MSKRVSSGSLPEIDKRLKRTVRRQIVDNIILSIERGTISGGQRLPTLDDLSNEYEVSMDTIAKSYNELKKMGLIFSHRGKGYYVSEC